MAGINKVILVGNLGNDPTTNYSADGKAITTISIATSDEWKDKNTGEKQSKTEWHRVVMFGPLADIAKQYLRKGSKVYIEGKLQTRKWTDKENVERYTTEVVLSGFGGVMQMLDSRSGGVQDFGGAPAAGAPAPSSNTSQPRSTPAPVVEDDFDDDIPF